MTENLDYVSLPSLPDNDAGWADGPRDDDGAGAGGGRTIFDGVFWWQNYGCRPAATPPHDPDFPRDNFDGLLQIVFLYIEIAIIIQCLVQIFMFCF